ncbi:hypothetical protein C8Q75DRAFT_710801 [Abortiporus biennis]|nr:hypothetical protein C8Q75DRAFT_710801 [Abortiporus biennis]
MAETKSTLASHILEDIAEKVHPPRRRDATFYLVLLFAVIPLWSIIPLSWAYVVYVLHTGKIWHLSWKETSIFAFALSEVFFSVYHYRLTRFISGPPANGPGNIAELQPAFKRVLQSGLGFLLEDGSDEEEGIRPGSPAEEITKLDVNDPRAVDFRNYLRTWQVASFGKVPWSSIRRQEMYAWLYWAIFNSRFTSLEDTPSSRQQILREVLHLLEKRAGISIPEGSNPASTPYLLTLDPINVAWRPFIWYLGVTLSNYVQRRKFESHWNAKVATYKGLEYVLRIPTGWSARQGPRPIVFLHGLGLGLTQYKLFLSHLLDAVPDHPVLIPLHPHVSQELFHPRYLQPMGRRESTETLAGLLQELGWVIPPKDNSSESDSSDTDEHEGHSGVVMISHSNGSFTHAWMLKSYPQMILRSCFVDPVTFCSWEGDLCYNFVYRKATTGLELLMKYFVGTELGVANFLQRHFDWSSNSLWFDEIPNARNPAKTMFFLGGNDAIVDAQRVKRYLTSHGIRKGLWFDPNGRHGQALLAGGAGHAEILRWLREHHL